MRRWRGFVNSISTSKAARVLRGYFPLLNLYYCLSLTQASRTAFLAFTSTISSRNSHHYNLLSSIHPLLHPPPFLPPTSNSSRSLPNPPENVLHLHQPTPRLPRPHQQPRWQMSRLYRTSPPSPLTPSRTRSQSRKLSSDNSHSSL